MPSTSTLSNYILFDAGMFIGALLGGEKAISCCRSSNDIKCSSCCFACFAVRVLMLA